MYLLTVKTSVPPPLIHTHNGDCWFQQCPKLENMSTTISEAQAINGMRIFKVKTFASNQTQREPHIGGSWQHPENAGTRSKSNHTFWVAGFEVVADGWLRLRPEPFSTGCVYVSCNGFAGSPFALRLKSSPLHVRHSGAPRFGRKGCGLR
ncbi:uncharacterized protein LOC127850473 isoform X3 [Dreissena polymorpha]|uniref:uncharacterized protein LOC127850473 isoform X3 n=1 Tax=Dreissena polymorpha TaxID=45954 RepID=UPI0022646A61|nr:uncharacterized protein LOC127850473 isoform X3 [Dreissena polymorpha]